MSELFQASAVRPPRLALSKISRAIRPTWEAGVFPPSPLVPRERLPAPRVTRILYRSIRYTGQSWVRKMMDLLRPMLYERHWSDRQLWYMLHWDWLQQCLREHHSDWVEPEIPLRLRNWLVAELQGLGFEVQLPLPPQTNTTALITWRASLYFNH